MSSATSYKELLMVMPSINTPRANPMPRRMQAGTSSSGVTADTFGWDTVFAIPVPYVNKAIVDHKSSPRSFSFTDPYGKYSCQGDFGDWQICQGGDGENLRMILPVMNIKGWLKPEKTTEKFIYEKLKVIIQIRLQFIPQEKQPNERKKGTFRNLIVLNRSKKPTEPVCSLVSVEWESGQMSPGFAEYVFEGALINWCNSNLAEFEHVFTTVNLDRYIDKKQWSFCNPTYTSYAYVDGKSLEDSVFGVLCMTGGHPPGNNLQQISPKTIPRGSQGGFLLSCERFLTDLVLPTLELQWKDAGTSKFTVSDKLLQLSDGASVELPQVKHSGSTYTPYLKKFRLTVTGQVLEIYAYTEVSLSPGITGWCESYHWYTIGIGSNKNGQTLAYNQHQAPVSNHGTVHGPGVIVGEIILGILAGIVILILGIVTDGATFVVGAILVGLLFGTAAASPEIVQLVQQDAAPSIDLLALNVSHPVTWPDSKDFKLTFASLNDSLQIGGHLGFV
jgi:hypothetical protein